MLREIDTRGAPLDAGTVHEDLNFSHEFNGLAKHPFDGFKVGQVAVYDFDSGPLRLDGVVGGKVGAVPLDKTDGSTGLSQSYRTSRADACQKR